MGAATAWHLARDGRSVLVLERFGTGHRRGSSHGATRVFRVAYRDIRYARLGLAALAWWRVMEDDTGTTLLDQCGQLDHGPAAPVGEIAGVLDALGRPVERLRAPEAAERWPGMRFDDTVVYSADGGRCYADATVTALQRRAVDHGADLHVDEPVQRIELLPGGVAVHTSGASYRAAVAVVAAGPWAGAVAGGTVPLPPLVVSCEQPGHFRPTVDGAERWPSFLHHRAGDSPLAFGAYGVYTPGLGMKVGVEGSGRVVDPEEGPFPHDPGAVDALRGYVATWFPGLDPDPVEVSTCLFTSTPDEHFVLDRRGPIVVCSPCSGHGFKFVPVIGRLVADLASGAEQADPAWRLPR